MLESALIENLEREDLNPIETAKAIRSLQERFHLTQEEIAEKLSKDPSTVSNLLRLLSLPDEVQALLLDGKIDFGHAKAILSIPADSAKVEVARKIVQEEWSVRRVESEARRICNKKSGDEQEDRGNGNGWHSLEDEFSRLIGTPVKLKLRQRGSNFQGTMEIQIQTKDDIDRVLGIARKGVLESRAG